ncbi:hypothetical protein Ahy_B05g075830 [Arachis hypogaea]|uniref:Uncharacterized protein n=1 Tax=Arachis hypogaea TaxID=3818 RepID=A0A444Z238_ARAHY|nr:hypothetical protein Ahy_B05g075830 [Arachis hypogaea]
MKQRSFFNIETATREVRISVKISQTSLVFSAKTGFTEESREDFERKKKKRTKTRTETAKAKMKKIMVTRKQKPRYNKTHDLRCQTKAIARVFKAMSQEKKDIVEEMGFGALAHVPEMNVFHSLLRELVDCYDDYNGYLKTLHGEIYITPSKVAAALGINHGGNRFPEKVECGILNEADKAIIDSFKCVTLASLTKSILDMSVEGEENR